MGKLDAAVIAPADTMGNLTPIDVKGFDKAISKIKSKFKFIENIQRLNKNLRPFVNSEEEFKKYEGKRINRISIRIIDPAGKTVMNPDYDSISKFDRFLNRMTVNTPKWVAKKELLFKEGEAVNPQLFSETERLFRQNNHFKDILIRIDPIEGSDWVNVAVVIQDRWSLNLEAEVGGNYVAGGFYLENYFGLSQDFEQKVYLNFNKQNPVTYMGMYRYRNIAGSRLNVQGYYKFDKEYYRAGFSIDRPFVSSKTKWAGSLTAYWNRNHINTNGTNTDNELKYNEQNVWLAGSFDPKIHNEKLDQMRFVIAGRFNRSQYTKRPYSQNADLGQYFFKERYYMLALGLANWATYKEKDVFYQSYFDYLPKGFNFYVTAGLQYYERFSHRFFTSASINHGLYLPKIGYNFAQFSFGGYIANKQFQQVTLKFENKYFTRMLPLRKWGFRQFIYNTLQLGFNRPSNMDYDVTTGTGGLTGLNSLRLRGTQKYMLNLESVVYCPYRILGFSASLFAFADLGVMWGIDGNYTKRFFSQAYGAGVRISNPGLGIGFIQLGFVYYPNYNVLGTGPINSAYDWKNRKEIGTYNLFNQNSMRPVY